MGKWGDVSDMQDYQGGRDFASLSKFAKDNLKPVCSPANVDLCDADQKAKIEELQGLSASDREAKIAEGEKKIADAEQLFKDELEKLQASYKKLIEDKDATIASVKDSGLGLVKAVHAHAAKSKGEL